MGMEGNRASLAINSCVGEQWEEHHGGKAETGKPEELIEGKAREGLRKAGIAQTDTDGSKSKKEKTSESNFCSVQSINCY